MSNSITTFEELAKAAASLDTTVSQVAAEFSRLGKTMEGFRDELDSWDTHSCSCAVHAEFAPCGHCESCPACNCYFCDDVHEDGLCHRCPVCYLEHDEREDGLCPVSIPVTSWTTQADLEKVFHDHDGPLGDKLAAVARHAAKDAVRAVKEVRDEDQLPHEDIEDEFELVEDE